MNKKMFQTCIFITKWFSKQNSATNITGNKIWYTKVIRNYKFRRQHKWYPELQSPSKVIRNYKWYPELQSPTQKLSGTTTKSNTKVIRNYKVHQKLSGTTMISGTAKSNTKLSGTTKSADNTSVLHEQKLLNKYHR